MLPFQQLLWQIIKGNIYIQHRLVTFDHTTGNGEKAALVFLVIYSRCIICPLTECAHQSSLSVLSI